MFYGKVVDQVYCTLSGSFAYSVKISWFLFLSLVVECS